MMTIMSRPYADLREPSSLEWRNRCYYLPSPTGAGRSRSPPPSAAQVGTHETEGQVPSTRCALSSTMMLMSGKVEERISKTELRLRMEDFEDSLSRIHFEVNGRNLSFTPSRTVANGQDQQWFVFDDPPLQQGLNTILLLLEGIATPDPWPSIQQCEILVLTSDLT